MMRLKALRITGTWRVLAIVNADGTCEVEEAIRQLINDRQTSATGNGFVALWSRIPREGPRGLGTDNYHRVDNDNEIYEFIRRRHRIPCFEADGALVVCSHVFLKSSQKTPKSEKDRAVALRDKFFESLKKGEIEVIEDDDEGEGE